MLRCDNCGQEFEPYHETYSDESGEYVISEGTDCSFYAPNATHHMKGIE